MINLTVFDTKLNKIQETFTDQRVCMDELFKVMTRNQHLPKHERINIISKLKGHIATDDNSDGETEAMSLEIKPMPQTCTTDFSASLQKSLDEQSFDTEQSPLLPANKVLITESNSDKSLSLPSSEPIMQKLDQITTTTKDRTEKCEPKERSSSLSLQLSIPSVKSLPVESETSPVKQAVRNLLFAKPIVRSPENGSSLDIRAELDKRARLSALKNMLFKSIVSN